MNKNTKQVKETKALIHEWILPYNPKFYDLASALKNLKIIDWTQSNNLKNAEVGDIVYIYGSLPESRIMYKGAILKINKEGSNIDDRKYNIPEATLLTDKLCMEIAVFRDYAFTKELSYKELSKNGIKSHIQGPMRLKPETSRYLHSIDKLQIASDCIEGVIPPTCLFPFPIRINEKLGNSDNIKIEALGDEYSEEEKQKHAEKLGIEELKAIAIKQSKNQVKDIEKTIIQKYRDPYITEYSKKRANGICQLCGNTAPFNNKNGEPYLESHHIVWLSKGGADSIDNIVALCPNCHKKMHVVDNVNDVEKLLKIVRE